MFAAFASRPILGWISFNGHLSGVYTHGSLTRECHSTTRRGFVPK
jgi:hypothetical protein